MDSVVVVNWRKYADFFELYEHEKASAKLVYVIGETHHCYVGSVGSQGGTGGLAVRYEWQYVNRSRAIFGESFPQNQPAFAGSFPDDTELGKDQIEGAEADVQKAFLAQYGARQAMFDPTKIRSTGIRVIHQGNAPAFLKTNNSGSRS